MSTYDQIATFLVVVESKSFTAAAEIMGLSANAVSKQISHLEEHLGVSLLARSTRHLELTEAGEIIYQKGQIARANLEEINQLAMSLQKEPKGHLSIVSTVGVGQYMLNKHFSQFLQRYPELDVHLQFSDQFPDLHSTVGEPVDIAYGFAESLVTDHLVHADLVRHRIYSFQRIVCAAPAYLSTFGEPKSYEDLAKHCLITHSKSIHNFIFRECRDRKITPARILTINNNAAILSVVLNGGGLASLPNVIIQDELAKGLLKPILTIHQEPEIPVYLFYKKTRYRPAKITHFLNTYGFDGTALI